MNANPARSSHRAVGVALFLALATVLVASVLLARQSAEVAPRLVTDSADMASPAEISSTYVPGRDRFYTTYAGNVCVKGEGLATITEIRPADGHGDLEVSGFSVFKVVSGHAIGTFDGERRLGDIAEYYGSHNVASTCSGDTFEEIALEFHKPERDDAWASDFTVHYVIDGIPGTTRIRLGIGLCERKDCNPFKV